jgi:polyferredoxin
VADADTKRKQKPRWLRRREVASPVVTACLWFLISFLGYMWNIPYVYVGSGHDLASALEFDLVSAVIVFFAMFLAVEVNVNKAEGRTFRSEP